MQCSRRDFLATSGIAVGAAFSGKVGLANSTAGTESESYQVVPDWPKEGYPSVQSRGLDGDAKGRIYVAGSADLPILQVGPGGKYLGCWGKDVLVGPHGMRIQGDTVWVTDTATHQVHQFTLRGKLIRSFGEEGVAGDRPDQFNKPTDFAFGPDGSIYISDGYKNTRVVCLAPDGSVRKVWGEAGTGPSQFNLVHAIAIDRHGRVYVGDRNNERVQIFDLDGNYLTEWNHLGKPYGFYACDDDTLFLCGLETETERFRVVKLDRDGKILADFGTTGDGPGQFLMAHSVYVDSVGDVIVADGTANRLQKFRKQA